jgi:hypothetical protein
MFSCSIGGRAWALRRRTRDLMPAAVTRGGRACLDRFRRATHSARIEPSFFLIGASRCGTTSLYDLVTRHPGVGRAARKEIEYFDLHYCLRDPAWYRSHFPLSRPFDEIVTGEATPSYLLDPRVPARLARHYPEAKLIVLLRDPVDRAYSHWAHEVALGIESLPFEQAIAAEAERTRGELKRMLADSSYVSWKYFKYTYLTRGRYADRLEPWLEHFPRHQLLALDFDHLATDQLGVLRKVLEFLHLPAWVPRSVPVLNVGSYTPVNPQTALRLADDFADANDRLERLLGIELSWNRPRAGSGRIEQQAQPAAVRLSSRPRARSAGR